MTSMPSGAARQCLPAEPVLADSVLSAPPARLLTMLYDRLLLDLGRAETAQQAANWPVASENLSTPRPSSPSFVSSLKTDAWDGADGLLGLYNYASTALVNANIQRDPALTREAIDLLEPLRQAGMRPPLRYRRPRRAAAVRRSSARRLRRRRGLEHPARNRWREPRFWLTDRRGYRASGEPAPTPVNPRRPYLRTPPWQPGWLSWTCSKWPSRPPSGP